MINIGIDIGTTTICIIALQENKVIYTKTINSDSFIKIEHEWERIQDVDTIIHKAKALLDECLEIYPDAQSIGLTGQMHGIVYIDENGQAVSPLYTWQDQRGQLVENGINIVDKINEYVKHPVASGYGLVTHAYHVLHHNVPLNAKYICTIMDYLGMLLTGNKKPITHVSNGASLGFWDIENNCFELDILEKFGIDSCILPDIKENIECLGDYHHIPVYIALGDNQASFLSAVGDKDDTVLLNMGTGGQVSLLANSYVNKEGIETRPFINGKYLLVGASLCGGRAYAILENFLRQYVKAATGLDQSQYDVMETLAKKVSDNQLIVTTTLKGTRAQPEKLGSIEMISEDNFLPEYLIYGFMEGMIQELYDMYMKMLDINQVKIENLMLSGNALRKNQVLRHISEKKFSLPSQLGIYQEEAAVGAAMSYYYKWEN